MIYNPKYDNDVVNLGYLNKRLEQSENTIKNTNNDSISKIPKNYSITPNPPYYKDSLLCYKNKIYKCNTTKLSGTFSWNDWIVVATDDTKISDFIDNIYELEKIKIQEQIDGKIQTYYQEADPANEWITDLEKSKHIGDYWYNTTNNTQWRYNQITTSSLITYDWGQVNIPNSIFDMIDTKKSIYTKKPTSYKKDDLWIIEKDLSDEDLPTGTEENPIAKGDWVFSVVNSDIYNKEHWVKRDEDINLSYLEQHYYTISDIDSSFEELERNTDSKITKAKEEIQLQVSQEYTAKEEFKSTINDFDKNIGTITETIAKHKESISNLSVEVGGISSSVSEVSTNLNNNYTNNSELDQKLENQNQSIREEFSTTITQSKSDWQASVIEYINQNGVEKFVNMLVTIDTEGLKLSKSDEDIVSLLNNKGLYVSDGKLREDLANLLMKVDRAGALFKLLEILGTIKEQGIIQKEKINDDVYGICQAWYWIGD